MGTLQENQSLNAEYERNKKEREMKEEIERLRSIIKEVREYIGKELDIEKICRQEKSLTICKKKLLEILDKESK